MLWRERGQRGTFIPRPPRLAAATWERLCVHKRNIRRTNRLCQLPMSLRRPLVRLVDVNVNWRQGRIVQRKGETMAEQPKFDLTGRVALVTGASSGLGAGFARVLAASGAKEGLAARRADKLAEQVAAI